MGRGAGVDRHRRSRGHSSACGAKTANCTSRTRRSTTPSTRTPGRAAQGSVGMSTPRPQHPPTAFCEAGPARPDFRGGQHPRAPARGRRPAHAWPLEGRTAQGAGNKSSVGVLLERTTRLLARMPDATAKSATAGFTAKSHQIAAPLRQTLTYDQGREMARHRELARNQHARVLLRPAAPGNAATARTRTGCCASSCPRARTCRSTARRN